MKLRPSQIIDGLVARGVPLHVAQGVAMNFRDESALDSGKQEQGGGGYGLAQWTGPRRAALEAFAKTQGKAVDDPDMQLDFFMTENAGAEKGAWDKVMATTTPQEAAKAFVTHWERPAADHLERRAAAYSGTTADSPGEGAGRFGGAGLGTPPPAVPVVPVVETPKPYQPEEKDPWSGLASGLASSVRPRTGMAAGGGGDVAIAPPPEFASAAPAVTPAAPVLPAEPIGDLASLFKVGDIGQAAALNLDRMGNPIRRRAYG